MKFLELEEKIEKWYGAGAFVILIILGILGFNSSEKLFQISLAFLIIPFLLLAIYALTGIKRSVKTTYSSYRRELFKEIKELRKEQKKIRNWKDLAKLDEEILVFREKGIIFYDNRFIKLSFYSAILFGIAAFAFLFDFQKLIEIPTWVIIYIFFALGIYRLIKVSLDLIRGL